jgi:DNA-binding response OmpR family regulator
MGWRKAGTAEMEAPAGSRILAVDDLPQNLELVEAHLGMLGHTVVTASNGVDALRMVKENAPHLILLDVMMPGLDGYEVCRRLKADESTAFIPVLILTALSAPDEIARAMEAGADDFLRKPFSGLELLIRVRSLLRLKKLRDQLENYRRMATVGEMVSGIANEMRNPLAITSSAAQILLRKGADPTLRQECAERIRTAVNRVAAIVENFLRCNHPSNGVAATLDMNPATTVSVNNLEGLKALGTQA